MAIGRFSRDRCCLPMLSAGCEITRVRKRKSANLREKSSTERAAWRHRDRARRRRPPFSESRERDEKDSRQYDERKDADPPPSVIVVLPGETLIFRARVRVTHNRAKILSQDASVPTSSPRSEKRTDLEKRSIDQGSASSSSRASLR